MSSRTRQFSYAFTLRKASRSTERHEREVSLGGSDVGFDIPYWMGGLPADAPPRRGTPEYDEFMAKRAQEAARPKTEQQQPK
jgi:hypothetical protein